MVSASWIKTKWRTAIYRGKYIENSYQKYGYDYNEPRSVLILLRRFGSKLANFLAHCLVFIICMTILWFMFTFIMYGLHGVFRDL